MDPPDYYFHQDSSSMMNYDDVDLRQQQQALLEGFQNKRQRLIDDDLESMQLAEAIAASENDLIQDIAKSERESEEIARHIHNEEIKEADHEFARALESSAQDHDKHQAEIRLHESIKQDQVRKAAERYTGSWDCTSCTYTNEPYRKHCSMCKTPPPPQVLTFENMSKLRFGLEIEIFIEDGKHDGFSFENIAQSLTRMGPPAVEFVGNTSRVCREWKIVMDSSLKSSKHDLCFELVSPILCGKEGLHELRVIMENVRRLGISTNPTCGFHVHVDAMACPDQAVLSMSTLNGIKKIARCFLALENAFDLLVGLTWENVDNRRRANHNKYCRSNRLAMGEASNRQRWERISDAYDLPELVRLVSPDRYRKLNLTNLMVGYRNDTCEFRNHGGVEDLKEAEAWVRLLLRFCERASTLNDSMCLLPQGATPKDELRALFELLSCAGLEQYFMIERRLFSEDRMYNPWSCCVCGKVFRNSRSLSQHCRQTSHGISIENRKEHNLKAFGGFSGC